MGRIASDDVFLSVLSNTSFWSATIITVEEVTGIGVVMTIASHLSVLNVFEDFRLDSSLNFSKFLVVFARAMPLSFLMHIPRLRLTRNNRVPGSMSREKKDSKAC